MDQTGPGSSSSKLSADILLISSPSSSSSDLKSSLRSMNNYAFLMPSMNISTTVGKRKTHMLVLVSFWFCQYFVMCSLTFGLYYTTMGKISLFAYLVNRVAFFLQTDAARPIFAITISQLVSQ